MKNKRFALLSLYNKEKIQTLCKILKKNKISIIATRSTFKYIKKYGYDASPIEKFTNFQEMLEGRVKTLHYKIYASLLFKRNNKTQINEFKKINFPQIDFLIVNLYPFEQIQKNKSTYKEHIEMIDIGGLSMIRAAAKNFNHVTTICNVDDYKYLEKNLRKNQSKTTLKFRKEMAAKVFETSYKYDFNIFSWLSNNKFLDINNNHFKESLRYGENPHQKSIYYKNSKKLCIDNSIVQSRKSLSYNNLLDINSALECINDFKETTCVIIKHNNPCGVASDKNMILAYKKSLRSDSISAFGGILIFNKIIKENLANLISKNFFEIVIAPSFNQKARKIFSKKNKLILIESKNIKINKDEIRKIIGGYLYQEKNNIKFSKKYLKHASKNKASKKIIEDIVFAFKVCKHVKSNAIVLAKNKAVIGIGAGQMSRIDSTKLALRKADSKQKKIGFIAASDAFFPFVDNIRLLIKNNCKAIVQPSGSINDSTIINYANKNKIPLYFSKFRFFKH